METMDIHAVSTSGQSDHSPQLRIVLIGGNDFHGDPTYKSATGNIILGKSVFDTNKRTAQSVVRQQEVQGRQVIVVDTPGWWWHYPRQNTPELDQIEIRNSVHLCSPGPHTFLLVLPVGIIFHRIFKQSLMEHLQLFHEGVFRHTIVLFTTDVPRSYEHLEDEISMYPALQWVLEQCGNRKHVLNIRNSQDSTQVTMLFEMIEAMVAENAGSYYSIDSAAGSALKEKMEVMVEKASQRFAEVQTKRRKLKALIEGVKTPPKHLRIVMVGAQWSAKSSAGNTILRKQAFTVGDTRTTEHCEIHHSMVANRQLTVVDSPGWYYNQTLQDTCEMDKLEIEYSMYQCPPGPNAVLLVVGLASAFSASYQRAVQEHMSLFTDEVWDHTIVLFTRGDWLGVKTVEERIESEKGLQWLMEKCGNRYHVNSKHGDEAQVTELLEKIEEMWAGNKDPYYKVDPGHAKQLEARKEAGNKMAKSIGQTTQRQANILRELFRGEKQKVTDMKVVLVGRKESGKSMAGNRMLFEEIFDTAWMKKEFQHQGRTAMCVKHQKQVSGVNITVVEAPGWLTNTMTPDWLKSEVLHGVSMCAPGPHAFLLVIPILKGFTEADRKAVVELLMPFGEGVWRHCMLLFTWKDWLYDRSIEEYIAFEGKDLMWLVEKCGNRYHVIRCNRFVDRSPVIELFWKIMDMITRNKGHYVTTEDENQKLAQPTLTEEEWNRREQELIDRMLKAVTQEPKESTGPSVKMSASMDGAFVPSMSGDAPSEVDTFCYQRAQAKVSEWLRWKVGNSDVTSAIGSMSASASYVEHLDGNPLTDEDHQPTRRYTVFRAVSVDTVGAQRRHSF